MNSIELFAGCGGLCLGVHQCDVDVVALAEIDETCKTTLEYNTDKLGIRDATHFGDIALSSFRQYHGLVDIVTGGPPCQPFSLGGKHLAEEDARNMFPAAVKVIRQTEPRVFIFENVIGLARNSFQLYYDYIKLQLSYPSISSIYNETWIDHYSRLEKIHSAGLYTGVKYNVVARVLNAADFGVPQIRKRVFFVGTRNDLHIGYSFPKPTHSEEALYHYLNSKEYLDMFALKQVSTAARLQNTKRYDTIKGELLAPWNTIRQALATLPKPELNDETGLNHMLKPGARSYTGHTGSVLDYPSKAIKAGVNGVPGGENMLDLGKDGVRYMTVREAARLQTFPDNFKFAGSWGKAMKQIGNAVPVDLGRIVTESVIKCI